MKKRISLLLALLLCLSLTVPAFAAEGEGTPIIPGMGVTSVGGFNDVKLEDYFASAVVWAAEKGITTGTSAGVFSPEGQVTRAQAVTFLWRAAGSPEPSGSAQQFPDVPDGQWYTKAVSWAVEKGVTNGTGNGFAPDLQVTRVQMLTFLLRAAGTAIGGEDWETQAMNEAVAAGLLDGIPGQQGSEDICPRSDVVYYLWKQYGV